MFKLTCTETVDYKQQATQYYKKNEFGNMTFYAGGGNADGWLFLRTPPRITEIKTKDSHAWEKFLNDVAERIAYLKKFTNQFHMHIMIKDGRHEIYNVSVDRTGELGLPVKIRVTTNELKNYIF